MTNRKEEHAYWGHAAGTYDAATAYVVGANTQKETQRWVCKQIIDTDHVLELGCGTGMYSMVIAEKAKHLTATDGSFEMLERVKERLSPFENVTIQREDCYYTSFPDGLFDVVFLGNVIHILGRPLEVLSESRRVLKPEGRILLVDFTSYKMPFWPKLAMHIRYLKKFGMPPKENRIMSPDDMAQLVEKTGFLVEAAELIEKETHVVCVRGKSGSPNGS
ncbi:MAG: class I SAM-dependent methyltransferase [Deltaproteobacteria bacterium]|nr:class I SAM-dependent methyltransferase [Deltaproteobacteria bacterium]